MPKFKSAKYPSLTLQDASGVWARFADGELETSDPEVAKRLRALPEDEGITEVKASPTKSGGAKTAGEK